MRIMKPLNLLRYSFMAFGAFSLLMISASTASAQYIRELNKDGEGSSAQDSVIYNPYIPQSTQEEIYRRVQPQQQQEQQQQGLGYSTPEQQEFGDAIYREFTQSFQTYRQNSHKVDPSAPQMSQLTPISTIPDDPMAYCKQYESKNPQQEDVQSYLENFMHERIKPVSQMRLTVPKSCLSKVKEIAQTMLVDYSKYKRNDLILRAGNNKSQIVKAAQTGNSLAKANMNYAQYAASECGLSRQQAAENVIEGLKLTEACEIQMLKKRIQQVAAM